jgi:hypothetical protein
LAQNSKDISLQDFLMATHPATFLICIFLPKAFRPQEDLCLDNDKTKERLLTKMEESDFVEWKVVLLISRYPQASTKKWIEENEKDVLILNLNETRRIYLSDNLEVAAI